MPYASAHRLLLALAFSMASLGQSMGAVKPHHPARADRELRTIVPTVLHHQHLLGPAALAEVLSRREGGLAPTQLPPELSAALRKREEASGRAEPRDVFAEDVVVLELGNGNRWVKGRAAAQAMAMRYSPDSRFLPVSYGIDGATAHVEGVVRTGTSITDELNFSLVLQRAADGAWQIVSENVTDKPAPDYLAPVTADDLIADMDRMGTKKAVILSLGYTLGRAPVMRAGEYDRVRAENDWNVAEASRFNGRLVVFCGVNPLRDYAVAEIARCAKLPFVRGVKLHLANSRVDVTNPEHLRKLEQVFRAADAHALAIVMHQWTPGDYGAAQSRIVLDRLLPAASSVPVQIAHLASAGPGYGPDEALAVYADAIAANDPRTRNLYFDLTTVVPEGTPPEAAALVARRLRQIGLTHVLFGSDMILTSNPLPSLQWETIKKVLPLSKAEMRVIARNIAPYVR